MLTSEDFEQIAKVFNLAMPNTYKIKDGFVIEGDEVWWAAKDGAQHVVVDKSHITNIVNYPHFYSISEPRFKLEYLD